MDKHYILNDGGKYYLAEGTGTYNIEDARRFESLNELVSTVPIMKDWNWDYAVYEVADGRTEKVDEKVWLTLYRKWREGNPAAYEQLYGATWLTRLMPSAPLDVNDQPKREHENAHQELDDKFRALRTRQAEEVRNAFSAPGFGTADRDRTVIIKPEFMLPEEELAAAGKRLDQADEAENTESRQAMLMWLGHTMGLPRELSLPITEHIHEFYTQKNAPAKTTEK